MDQKELYPNPSLPAQVFEQPMMIFVIAELFRQMPKDIKDRASLAILRKLDVSNMVKH
jgi:hypothetical protein